MSEFIFHTTKQNERWDNIAYQYYGNTYNIKPLIEANPHIKINGIISANQTIKIPIIKDESDNSLLLPIWKRGT